MRVKVKVRAVVRVRMVVRVVMVVLLLVGGGGGSRSGLLVGNELAVHRDDVVTYVGEIKAV